jgi:hypothetical protein
MVGFVIYFIKISLSTIWTLLWLPIRIFHRTLCKMSFESRKLFVTIRTDFNISEFMISCKMFLKILFRQKPFETRRTLIRPCGIVASLHMDTEQIFGFKSLFTLNTFNGCLQIKNFIEPAMFCFCMELLSLSSIYRKNGFQWPCPFKRKGYV